MTTAMGNDFSDWSRPLRDWARAFGASRQFAFAKAKGRRGFPRPEQLERMAALQHLHGGPQFGGGPMPGPPFGGGRGRARRGDVRLALLTLLGEGPRNGYQLMQAIEERSGGRWRPSPGSVYPTLAQLEDEGLIHSIERDGTKLLELTDAGREYLERSSGEAPPWDASDDPDAILHVEVRALMHQVALAARQVVRAGDRSQIERASQILADTRRALYRILAESGDD